MPKIRILVASDYRLTRTGLKQLLKSNPEFDVVAEAEITNAVPELHRQFSCDVVLLEIAVPGPHGLRTAAKLLQDLSEPKIVVITANENICYVRSMFAAGVLGYVLRKASETELFASLRSAYHGRRYLDPRLSDSVADLLLGARGTLAGSRGIPLSGRELQVLHGVAQGFTSQDLAKQMSLSAKTVETYRSRIYQKLGLHTRADLVHYAIAFGLLSDEPLMQ